MDWVPETCCRFWKRHGEMGLRQVELDFSSFFAKFLAYLIIFQSFTISTLEKSFETEILCSQLKIHLSRPISGTYLPTYPKNSVSRMYPFRHYFLVYDI